MGRFVFREDVAIADCAVEVWGDSLADLLETSARALAELMADPDSIAEHESRPVSLTADSEDLMLFDWLSEILFLKDRDRLILPRAEVRVSDLRPFRLTATLFGDVVDPEHTRRKIDVKAVTMHELRVAREGREWHGHFVVDL
jgi:SHS2 domain-containing protein